MKFLNPGLYQSRVIDTSAQIKERSGQQQMQKRH